MDERPHVLVIGGGFGGLSLVRALASAPVRVTLVDRTNHHLFQPLLYQVATAGLSAPDIAAPLRHILRRQANVTVLMDEAQSFQLDQRRVAFSGGPLDYDYLVVAAGAGDTYFGHDDWATHAPGLKTLDDALAIRGQILAAFEAAEREDDPARRQPWLNFVVVGGGPTGVELAGTLVELARHTLPREFRRAQIRSANVHLVEAGPRVLPAMPESLSRKTQEQLERLGVQVHTEVPVSAIDADGVDFGDTRVASHTVLWAAGVAASPLGGKLGVDTDKAGRVPVADDLSLPGYGNVFVIGDLASVKQGDSRVPGIAPAAKQMGKHAAAMIRRRLAGKPTSPFRYRDYGNLATVGRRSAVVDLGKLRFSGTLAWWFWLVAHVFFLIGFRNRIAVLGNWAWSYWTYQRHARIIVGIEPHGDDPGQVDLFADELANDAKKKQG